MVNKVILIGNLGRDPELRYTSSGTAVANFTLATNRRVKKGESWEDETEWHRVVAWARTAEIVNQYCQKGKQVYVEGRLQTRQWEDREGQTKYTTEVVVENLKLLGGRGETGGSWGQSPGGSGAGAPGEPAEGEPITDEDIPF